MAADPDERGRRLKYRLRTALGGALAGALAPFLPLAILSRRIREGPRLIGSPRSVLLVRFDLMGDVVNALAAAHAARRRWPAASIVFIAPPQWRPVVARCSAVDHVVSFDGGALTHWPRCLDLRAWLAALRVLRWVRRRRFDLALSVYGPIAGTLVALSGARERVGYAAEAPAFSFDRALPGGRRNQGPHESVLACRLVGPEPPLWHTLDRTDDLRAPGALAGATRPLIVAHPGAAHGNAKRWPEEHWCGALSDLRRRLGGTVAVVGLDADQPLARRLGQRIEGLIDLTGATTLEDLMAVLHAADLVISTDSGPAHLARSLGTRVIALHGPTDVHLHGPGGPNGVALRVEIPCGPCYAFRGPAECVYGDVLCMRWLEPRQVVQAACRGLDAAVEAEP